MSIGYVTIGTNDLARSRKFYDAVMPHLGGTLDFDFGDIACCYKFDDGRMVWVTTPENGKPALAGNGIMPGFACASEEAVQAAHAAALAHGGTDEGAPGPRPQYGPDFFGAYARDPEGNKMSFVHMRAAPE